MKNMLIILLFTICLILVIQTKAFNLNSNTLSFRVLEGLYSVCRLERGDKVPEWINKSKFYSITETNNELSIVSYQENIPASVKSEKNWKIKEFF